MRSADSNPDKALAETDTGPRSSLRTVQILHELSSSPGGLSLATLAARLQLPKTSVFRLLRALEGGGYVISMEGMHQIGPQAMKLGTSIVQNRVFPNCALPAMRSLYDRSKETVIMGTLCESGTNVVFIEVIEASNPLRFTVDPGTTKPLYCSANGQTIIAHMPAAQRERYFKSLRFQPFAPRTISSVAELKRKVDDIHATGVSVSVDGMYEGVYSVAAPIVDAAGAVHAGISVTAPTTRAVKHEKAWAAYVRETAEEISRVLGYTGPYPPV